MAHPGNFIGVFIRTEFSADRNKRELTWAEEPPGFSCSPCQDRICLRAGSQGKLWEAQKTRHISPKIIVTADGIWCWPWHAGMVPATSLGNLSV